jgi:hypothetical protein
MIVDRQFYSIKCDACGRQIDEAWWDDKDALTTQILNHRGWIECKGRHYCDECWEFYDDDNIVTKDGRKWTGYDHKEIRQPRMNYLSLSEDMTLTQFRMELVNGKALFDSMVGSLFDSVLFDDLTEGKEWFEEMLVARKGTPEFDCYSTFASHGIFRLAQIDAHERMYNRNK